jgi:hypothetical protein
MITGELKNRIDSIWEIFWTGGLTNPLDVIEQMTYGKRGYWLKERVDVRIGYKVHTKFKISLKQFLGQEES